MYQVLLTLNTLKSKQKASLEEVRRTPHWTWTIMAAEPSSESCSI